MRVVLLKVLRYTLLRHRLLLRQRSLQKLLTLRLQFIRPDLLPARRNPVVPPKEINRGVETGVQDVTLPGIGTLANGVVNALMKNSAFEICLFLRILLFWEWCPRRPSTILRAVRLMLTTFL